MLTSLRSTLAEKLTIGRTGSRTLRANAGGRGKGNVLKMVDIEFIRKKHWVEGWSVRKISRQLQVSRQTVRKVIAQSEPPRYRLSENRACPVMDPHRALIAEWLDADLQAPAKQRHTARRIYDRLVKEEGFTGGSSTVRRYVAGLRVRPREVFIPLTAGWGQQAQVDWGQAHVGIASMPEIAHLFCLRMRASGVPFVWASPTEKMEAFLEGHVQAFTWMEGVPRECVYDNAKTAVVRILAGPQREEHTLFSSLRSHFLFDSQFCRPAEPHEKGAVENLVGYVRRNALVPVPNFASWDALNAHLLAWCEEECIRHADAWTKERAQLRPLPAHPFLAAVVSLAVVSRLSLVTVDHNRYSVPCAYVGQSVRVLLFTERIEIWDKDNCLARHTREYRRGETALELAHYLPALAQKPRAVTHAALISQLPAIYATVRDQLCRAHPEGYREFAAILLLHREFASTAIERALEEARTKGCLQASAVRQLVLNHTAPTPPPPLLLPPRLGAIQVTPPNLAQYNTLFAEVAR